MFTVDDILRRQSAMETWRANWDDLWAQVAKKLLPVADDFNSQRSPGSVRTNQQYDAFPGLALNRYAAAVDSGLTPRTTMWHGVTTGEPSLDEEDETKAYLQQMSRMLWSTRYSPKANFANQNHELFISHGAFGNGCMFVEAHPDGGCSYRSIHLSQIFVQEDRQGFIDTFHRKFPMTARQIRDRVVNDGWTMPAKVAKAIEKKELDAPFDILHVVMPREDHDPDRLDFQGMRYTDIYICVEDKSPLYTESGFRELPYMFARNVTSTSEMYGRGPGVQMFPDIKMLNEMKRDIIEVANMAADPPTLLHEDGILGAFRATPGARNYGGVDENGRPRAIPYQNGANPGLGLELVQDTRNQIDDGFMGIYFRVLLENPQMTATQALLIAQQQGQMTAPTVGRLQSEYLDNLIRRESGITFRQGRHPPMPDALRDYLEQTNQRLRLEYESPMTRAARTGEAIALQQTFEALSPWAQVKGPEVYDRFDGKKVAELLSKVNGVPQDVLKTDEQLEAEDEQKAMQQAAQMALQAAPVAAQTVETLGRAQAQAGSAPGQLPV